MDAAWTICPHCGLKHRPRAQSLCPRCGRTSAAPRAPVAAPTPPPRAAPVRAAAVAASAHAAAPAPAGEFVPTVEYIPDLGTAPLPERMRAVEPQVAASPQPASTLGLGGAILLINAALHLFEFLFLPSLSSDGPLRAVQLAGTLVGVGVDALLGIGFLQGKTHLRTLALVRLVVGMFLFGGISLYQAQFLFTLVVFAFSCGVLVLVWGKPSSTLAGVGLTAVMLSGAVEVVGFLKLSANQSLDERARIALRPDLEGRPLTQEDTLAGNRHPYSLPIPSDGWYRHKAGSPGALDAPTDLWLSHPELNGHLLVAIRDNPEEIADVREAKEVALHDLRTRFPDFQETEPSEPGPADITHFTGTATRNGKPFLFEVSLHPTGKALLRVTAAAPPEVFDTLHLGLATTRVRAR
ncbi:hypothetical protein [Melittangium boletus]|uniref:Uncharacterized protein n=1 Tax=Melittangium boletus DSM 14713 TaxID=1294270 RepID=A0A250IPF6_9BACT|nr:hypothetical protein [Melittangium boletus]ATB33061.1 hypothetical protein MEBOL_006550 [Melittangium boletus DSM 14713]